MTRVSGTAVPLAALAAPALALLLLALTAGPLRAQERPYFVTYNQELEEPGNLEVELNPTYGTQREGGSFLAGSLELEYGVTGWWTSELYLAGQSTHHDTTLFTGYRWENRLRPLAREHLINPVLYLELESLSDADKTLLEVVGHDGEADQSTPNEEARLEEKHELETKLILSSNLNGWNVSGNLIAEKNLSNEPWELGYAFGVSRTLALAARADACSFCLENFTAGVELYGGLGTVHDFGLTDTSHYAGAVLAWDPPGGVSLRVSPAFGLNRASHRFLLRFGMSYEIPGLGHRIGRLLRGER